MTFIDAWQQHRATLAVVVETEKAKADARKTHFDQQWQALLLERQQFVQLASAWVTSVVFVGPGAPMPSHGGHVAMEKASRWLAENGVLRAQPRPDKDVAPPALVPGIGDHTRLLAWLAPFEGDLAVLSGLANADLMHPAAVNALVALQRMRDFAAALPALFLSWDRDQRTYAEAAASLAGWEAKKEIFAGYDRRLEAATERLKACDETSRLMHAQRRAFEDEGDELARQVKALSRPESARSSLAELQNLEKEIRRVTDEVERRLEQPRVQLGIAHRAVADAPKPQGDGAEALLKTAIAGIEDAEACLAKLASYEALAHGAVREGRLGLQRVRDAMRGIALRLATTVEASPRPEQRVPPTAPKPPPRKEKPSAEPASPEPSSSWGDSVALAPYEEEHERLRRALVSDRDRLQGLLGSGTLSKLSDVRGHKELKVRLQALRHEAGRPVSDMSLLAHLLGARVWPAEEKALIDRNRLPSGEMRRLVETLLAQMRRQHQELVSALLEAQRLAPEVKAALSTDGVVLKKDSVSGRKRQNWETKYRAALNTLTLLREQAAKGNRHGKLKELETAFNALPPPVGDRTISEPEAFAQAWEQLKNVAASLDAALKELEREGARPLRHRVDPLAVFDRSLEPSLTNVERLATGIGSKTLIAQSESRLTRHLSRVEASSQLARPLVPSHHQALFASIGRLDAGLARTRGARDKELRDGTEQVARSLGEMAALAEKVGYQSASTVKAVRDLMEQRREALARLATGQTSDAPVTPAQYEALDGVTRQLPGLGKVLGPRPRAQGVRVQALIEKFGGGGLSRLEQVGKTRSRSGLMEVSTGGGGLQSLGQVPGVGALTVQDVLGGKLGQPYAKSWLSSVGNAFKSAAGGLAKLGQTAVKKGISHVKQSASKAVKLGGQVLGGAAKVAGGLAKLQQKAVKSALSVAVKGAGAGWNLVKKTAGALGAGMRSLSSRVGDAAKYAWDSTKHAVKLIGNGAAGLAKKTGGLIKGAWSQATGVVGAIGGKIRSGLSSAASWVGDKAKKVGGALLGAAQWAGKKFLKHHPLGKALTWGWDKFGKKAWDKTKSLASAAWESTKKVGQAAGRFLQSPAGQLLTTGLSVAATFIPGGLLVKAGIGAVMGAIEAVSKGGGLKEALMGAAMGGLEGALPLMKLKTVGKLAVGGVKGGLQAAINGGDFKDIGKGMLGGALNVGGFSLLKKVGGGRGLKALDQFMSGGSSHAGVLGKLQKVAGKGGLQKLYVGAKKLAPKIVKGAGWVYDKSGKLHGALQKVLKGGKYAKGALEGVSWLSDWGSRKLGDDSSFGRFLGDVSDLSQQGADGLKKPLEYVKKVDDVVGKVHEYTGKGLKLAGVDPRKQQKETAKKQEIQRRMRKQIESDPNLSEAERQKKLAALDAKTSTFDRVDNWFANKTNKVGDRFSAVNDKFGQSVGRMKGLLASTPFGLQVLEGGRKLGDWGATAHAHAQSLAKIYGKGVKYGEAMQQRLRDFVLLTAGADDDQPGSATIRWMHENARAFEKQLSENLKAAKHVQAVTNLAVDAGGVALDATGHKDKRQAYGEKADYWWGQKKADPKKQTTVAGAPNQKTGKDASGQQTVVVAPWVKYGEQLDEKLKGTEKDPTRLKQGIDKLEAWRKEVKRAADKAARDKVVYEKTEDDKVDASRARGGLRLLGANDKTRDADWAAFEEREKKAAEAKAKKAEQTAPDAPAPGSSDAGNVTRELTETVEKKVEERARIDAREVAKDERQAIDETRQETSAEEKKQDAEAGAESNDELQALFAALLKLEKARAQLLETGDTGRHASLRTEALLLLGRFEWAAKHTGTDLSAQRDRVLDLMAFFNGGKAYHADDDRRGGLGSLPPPSVTALGEVVDEDGVAGRVEKPGSGVLATLNDGFAAGFEGAGVTSQDPRFEMAVHYLDLWEEQLLGDLPRLEHLAGADAALAMQVYTALLRKGRQAERELERLGRAILPDEPEAPTLVKFAERYAALRGRLRAVSARIGATSQPQDVSLEAPEAVLVDGSAGASTTPGAEVPAAEEGAGPTYLDEVVEDTWIGSGSAARPIADGLANNFKFEDLDGAQPSLGGALARLGGAVQGLGSSVKGASGDFGGLMGELGTSTGLLGGLGSTVGELLDGRSDNDFTQAMGQAGEFTEWVKQGAAEVGQGADKVTDAGGKLTEAGRKLEQNGVRLFGRVYRKGRAGTGVTGKKQSTEAGQYLDAPRRLDYAITLQMERFLGAQLRDVKIHTGKGAELITRRYDAEAVTIKDHIFFAPGRYDPSSLQGRKLLAHELTHVTQRTRPNLDTRTAEEEAHKAEALFGSPSMDVLDLSHPQADFRLDLAGAEQGPAGIRTAKKQRSVSADSGAFDEPAEGEELLDLVGERVHELMLAELEREFENS